MADASQTNKNFRVQLVDGTEFLLSEVRISHMDANLVVFAKEKVVVAVVPISSLAMCAETSVFTSQAAAVRKVAAARKR